MLTWLERTLLALGIVTLSWCLFVTGEAWAFNTRTCVYSRRVSFLIHQRLLLDLASAPSLLERRRNFNYRASACLRWSWRATTTERFA